MPVRSIEINQSGNFSQVAGLSLSVTWDQNALQSTQLTPQNFQDFQSLHRSVRQPRAYEADVASLGRLLQTAASITPNLTAPPQRLELYSANNGPLLTDVLWETAQWRGHSGATLDWRQLFDCSLASLPLARVVQANGSSPLPQPTKSSLLWCQSNEPITNAALNLTNFDAVFKHLSTRSWPVKLEKLEIGSSGRVTWDEVKTQLQQRLPQILVLIAHGYSSVKSLGNQPGILFKNPLGNDSKYTGISDIAAVVAKIRSVDLVVLLCCDLTQTSGVFSTSPTAVYSAALKMVQAGAPQVVAMQAPIDVMAAASFAHAFLVNLFSTFNTPAAACAGRDGTIAGPEPSYAWLPTLFCSRDFFTTPSVAESHKRTSTALRNLISSIKRKVGGLKQKPIVNNLLNRFLQPGLMLMRSSDSLGSNNLICSAIDQNFDAGSRRPILYFDCSLANPNESVTKQFLFWLKGVQKAYPVLFPFTGGRSDLSAAEEFLAKEPAGLGRQIADFLEQAELIVVLDNVKPLTNDEDRAALPSLQESATSFEKSLLVWCGSLSVHGNVELDSFNIPNLTAENLTEFLSQNAPEASPLAADLFAKTAGDPLLIELFHTVYKRIGAEGAMIELADQRDVALRFALKHISEDAAKLLHRLAIFDVAVPYKMAHDFLFWDIADETRAECVEFGLTREDVIGGTLWLKASSFYQERISQIRDIEIEEEAENILSRFRSYNEVLQALDHILGTPGAVRIASYLAKFHYLLGEVERAFGIADKVLATPGPLSEKFEFARLVSSWAVEQGSPDYAKFHLEAARLASWTGHLNEVQKFLDLIEPGVDAEVEARAKLMKARLLKDTEQQLGVDEALKQLNEASALVDLKTEAFGNQSQVEAFRWQLEYEKLRLALFFALKTGIGRDQVEQFLQKAPSPSERARVLATAAEAEMKRGSGANWELVSGYTLEAATLAENEGPKCPFKGFCVYQYARYLESHTGEHELAISQYEKAEQLARGEEDYEREGLAFFRRISLIPRGNEVETRKRLEQIEQVLQKIARATSSALGNRVRVRLHLLASDLCLAINEVTRSVEYLQDAVSIASASFLLARSDFFQLLKVLDSCLVKAQKLPSSFRVQQSILLQGKYSVQRLTASLKLKEIIFSIDRPMEAQKRIHEYLESEFKNGI